MGKLLRRTRKPMKKDIYVLGIESSCDETSMSIVKNGRDVVSLVISSQIDIHKLYGGVVPEIASRNHVLALSGVFEETLKKANMTMSDIDAIAVTYGAGLLGALIVGVNFAKGLAFSYNKPLVAVNHIEGHIAANYISHKELEPPFACLIVSGGHTALVKMEDYVTRKLYGSTTDDAVGEAFDKVARELGLEYPGGPNVQKWAEKGQENIRFVVKPHEKFNGYNFSYSGLKTAVINYIHNRKQKGEEVSIADVCASFQAEAVNQLVSKSIHLLINEKLNKIVISGGVSANKALRTTMDNEANKIKAKVYYPELVLCTDNAAMIASAGYYNFIAGKSIVDPTELKACANVPL